MERKLERKSRQQLSDSARCRSFNERDVVCRGKLVLCVHPTWFVYNEDRVNVSHDFQTNSFQYEV